MCDLLRREDVFRTRLSTSCRTTLTVPVCTSLASQDETIEFKVQTNVFVSFISTKQCKNIVKSYYYNTIKLEGDDVLLSYFFISACFFWPV